MGAPHKEKQCSECLDWKSVEEFYRSGARGRDAYCKECRRLRDRNRSAQSKANRTKLLKNDPLYFRRRKLMSLYGITHERWLEMYEEQGGVCAICHKPERRILYGNVSHLVVDHDHATGAVRALLCCRCNAALGVVEDYVMMEFLIEYMKKYARPGDRETMELIYPTPPSNEKIG